MSNIVDILSDCPFFVPPWSFQWLATMAALSADITTLRDDEICRAQLAPTILGGNVAHSRFPR